MKIIKDFESDVIFVRHTKIDLPLFRESIAQSFPLAVGKYKISTRGGNIVVDWRGLVNDEVYVWHYLLTNL